MTEIADKRALLELARIIHRIQNETRISELVEKKYWVSRTIPIINEAGEQEEQCRAYLMVYDINIDFAKDMTQAVGVVEQAQQLHEAGASSSEHIENDNASWGLFAVDAAGTINSIRDASLSDRNSHVAGHVHQATCSSSPTSNVPKHTAPTAQLHSATSDNAVAERRVRRRSRSRLVERLLNDAQNYLPQDSRRRASRTRMCI